MKRLVCVTAMVFGLVTQAELVEMKVNLANPVLQAEKVQKTYLKVALAARGEGLTKAPRPQANVAIVIDRSSSMQGDKIVKAKEAAILALHRLNQDDIVSVLAYSSGVNVLVTATKLHDRGAVEAAIDTIQASGSTALFAGVSKGAAEVREFLQENSINRVVLLSDGQANQGPGSPA